MREARPSAASVGRVLPGSVGSRRASQPYVYHTFVALAGLE